MFRAQVGLDPASFASIVLLLRVVGNPQTLIPMIRAEVEALDSRLFVSSETVAATIARDSERYATVVRLTVIPAGIAAFLSMVGIYGVTAFGAAGRRAQREYRSPVAVAPRVRAYVGDSVVSAWEPTPSPGRP